MTKFENWTVKALKEYAKEKNIKIPPKSKKADIILLLNQDEKNHQQVELIEDSLTNRRQQIIKKVLSKCRKDGEQKIIDFFEQRNKNTKLKQTFDAYQIDLQNPSFQDIRICLKYYQVTEKYNKGDKLLINQMITQPKYIDPKYVDERKRDMENLKKATDFVSATFDVPASSAKKRDTLNSPIEK